MSDLKVANVTYAIQCIKDDMSPMVGGIWLCGIPENASDNLVELNVKGLTCISNNAVMDDF